MDFFNRDGITRSNLLISTSPFSVSRWTLVSIIISCLWRLLINLIFQIQYLILTEVTLRSDKRKYIYIYIYIYNFFIYYIYICIDIYHFCVTLWTATTLPQVIFNSLKLYNDLSILYVLSGEFQLKFQI